MNDKIQRSAGWWRRVADGDQRPQKGHLIQTGVGLREIQEDFQEEEIPDWNLQGGKGFPKRAKVEG